MTITAIVEGDGDEPSVRILANRLLDYLQRWDIQVSRVKNAKGKPKLIRKFENFINYASLDGDCDAILVLVDADNECPTDAAKALASRAGALNLGIPIAIVMPNPEFEVWFIASLDSSPNNPVRTRLDLPSDTVSPDNPDDATNSAKGWLNAKMPRNRRYKETSDQPALSAAISLSVASQHSRSFQRLEHAIIQLIDAVDNGVSIVTPWVVE